MNLEIKETTIEQVIKDYLRRDTSYAIMLTAPWGAGKTHFIKNVVFKNLDNTGYKGIMVSLYGVNHIDDIKNRILISLYPLINSKVFQRTTGLLKGLIKTVDLNTLFPSPIDIANTADEVEKGIKKLASESIDFKQIVLCFDDLERANPNILTSNEILGYINSLVEDENIKVILIANKDKIGDPKFDEIKEKVIGNILHFIQDFDQAFESILQQLKDPTAAFLKDIRKHKQTIKSFMENGGTNYRTLKYFLSYFQPVAHSLHTLKHPDLKEYKDHLFAAVIKFMLMISIEFKKGEISYKDSKNLENYVFISALRKLASTNNTSEQYNQKTITSYYSNDESFYFYKSLYDYITGGNVFLKDDFYSEIYKQYNVREKNIPEAYKRFNRLEHWELHKLSDHEHTSLLRDIRKHLYDGEYLPQDFLTLFFYLTRFKNPLRLSKEKLKNDMLNILKRNKHKYRYTPGLEQFLHIDEKTENDQYYIPLRQMILELNEEVRDSKQKAVNRTINELYFNNLDACSERIRNNQSVPKEKISLSFISPNKFFSRYLKSNNLEKEKINNLIATTYDLSTGNYEKEDLQFLRDVKAIIEGHISVKAPSNVSGWLIGQLLQKVNYMINRISNINI